MNDQCLMSIIIGVDMSQSVQDLRDRWKPIKDNEASEDCYEPIRIRLHRCWSWMERIEELENAGVGHDDPKLIYYWIALNSLYGRWDDHAREPIGDRYSLGSFLDRIFDYDHDELIPQLLTENRELVKAIVGDEFLNKYFWQDPGENEARKAQNTARKLPSMHYEGRFGHMLEMAITRIYFIRCQLVHGAATYDSKLNRDAVARCSKFLGEFLQAVSSIIIDHAWKEDWGSLCYPPIDTQ